MTTEINQYSPSAQQASLKRQLLFGLLGALVVILFLGGIKFFQVRKAIAEHSSFAMPPEAVTTISAAKESWPELFEATADLTPTQGIMLKNELSGRISEIFVSAGQKVEAGAPIISLSTSTEKAELLGAQAELTRAEKEYSRSLTLQEAKAVSQGALDLARANLSLARAKVDALKATLEKKNITAPFTGTVGMRMVNLGEILDMNTSLMPLQSTDSLFLNFSVPQRALSELKTGSKIYFQVDTYPGKTFEAVLNVVNPQVEMDTRLIKLQAVYDNRDLLLKPGMFASVILEGTTRQDFVTIPATSIQYTPYSTTVFVVESKKTEDGKESKIAASLPVKLGSHRGDQVAIVSGLAPGQEVITSGVFKLYPGAPVMPNPAFGVGNSANPSPMDT